MFERFFEGTFFSETHKPHQIDVAKDIEVLQQNLEEVNAKKIKIVCEFYNKFLLTCKKCEALECYFSFTKEDKILFFDIYVSESEYGQIALDILSLAKDADAFSFSKDKPDEWGLRFIFNESLV